MKPHVGVTAAIVCLAIAACAGPATVPVPASLEPAAGEALAVEVAAKGVQIYECRAKGGKRINGGSPKLSVARPAEQIATQAVEAATCFIRTC